jgi:IPT/TIG domain
MPPTSPQPLRSRSRARVFSRPPAYLSARSHARRSAPSRLRLRGLPLLLLLLLLSIGGSAPAAGPRWVPGSAYFNVGRPAVVWYTNSPLYFTDPGNLSASVNHAAADALVAAAAAVWNVPSSLLLLSRGGALQEHVSSANVYMGSNGLVFPSDVSSANYAAKQIAILYDSDGSVTDLLLGQGASDPSGCRQTAVTESVDAITPQATIEHALLILNGRCTGPDPAQQLQLQYQLMRAFGRILGLGWSQTNDNVFTGSPAPTYAQALNWPILHPIDVICGVYTYQCLPQPFTLRLDDIASISELYPIAQGQAPAGKQDSLARASVITGDIVFPDGQGMQGVNVLVRRHWPATYVVDGGPVVSAVTGMQFRWIGSNAITGQPATTIATSMGVGNPAFEGAFSLGWIPLVPGLALDDALLSTEPINPLYTGPYSVGPYQTGTVTPSGPALSWSDNGVVPYESNFYYMTAPGAVATCNTAGQGTKAAPAAVPASGWWTGNLCGYGYAPWSQATLQGNRSFTVEVTALDEQKYPTTAKLRPLVGVWQPAASPTGSPSSATPASFNSIANGLTSLQAAVASTGAITLAIADDRGDGRPDYAFQARLLYADSITPALVSAGGGLVTIHGMGFRAGNTVTVHGVPATVLGWSATSILAVVPPFASLNAGSTLAVDVAVTDPTTQGTTVMTGALSYPAIAAPSQAQRLLALTPSLLVAAGMPVPIAEQVSLSASGVVSVGVGVNWAATPGSGLGALQLSSATTTSSTQGLAAVTAILGPLAPGQQAVGLACAWTAVCASFSGTGVDPALWTPVALLGGTQTVAAGGVLLPVVLEITDGAGNPVVGAPVQIYQSAGGYQLCPPTGRCPAAPVYSSSATTATSDINGLVVIAPEQVGEAETTRIAIATGPQGFLTLVLQKTP